MDVTSTEWRPPIGRHKSNQTEAVLTVTFNLHSSALTRASFSQMNPEGTGQAALPLVIVGLENLNCDDERFDQKR